MSINHEVTHWDYSKSHYIKKFGKKYKTAWRETLQFIEFMCWRPDRFLVRDSFNKIYSCESGYIAKWEFAVAWTNISPKNSWNRFIVYVDTENQETVLLMIYSKDNIKWSNETVWWEGEIKWAYKDICDMFEF